MTDIDAQLARAPLGRRAGAAAVDSLILLAAVAAVSIPAEHLLRDGLTVVLSLLISVAVLAIAGAVLGALSVKESSIQTIGHSMFGIHAVLVSGGRPARSVAVVRYLVGRSAWLLALPWLIADAVAVLERPDRRALHDLIAGTHVLARQPPRGISPSPQPEPDPLPSPRRSPPATGSADIAARLAQIDRLYEAGSLSEDEYDGMRAQIQRLI